MGDEVLSALLLVGLLLLQKIRAYSKARLSMVCFRMSVLTFQNRTLLSPTER